MKTILLTFEDESQRDEYLKIVRTMAASLISSGDPDSTKLIVNTLDNVKFDPPVRSDSERQTALFVAGQKMTEGSLEELNKLFAQEITQHSGSVQIREMREGDWHIIRQRPSR
jgi:hypothetical protein